MSPEPHGPLPARQGALKAGTTPWQAPGSYQGPSCAREEVSVMKRMKRWLWAGLVMGLSLAAPLANAGWLSWDGID